MVGAHPKRWIANLSHLGCAIVRQTCRGRIVLFARRDSEGTLAWLKRVLNVALFVQSHSSALLLIQIMNLATWYLCTRLRGIIASLASTLGPNSKGKKVKNLHSIPLLSWARLGRAQIYVRKTLRIQVALWVQIKTTTKVMKVKKSRWIQRSNVCSKKRLYFKKSTPFVCHSRPSDLSKALLSVMVRVPIHKSNAAAIVKMSRARVTR